MTARREETVAPADQFKAAGAALAKLALALNSAQDSQWERPPYFRPKEDTTERAKGRHRDPTSDVTTDGLRLELREAVKHAEKIMALTTRDAQKAERELTEALARWRGEIDEDH